MEKNNVEVVKSVKKERMNIYVFSILMFVAFVLTFYFVHMFLSSFLFSNLVNNVHSYDIIGEAIVAILAFIVLLFWKNSYVFTQNQEKLIPSLRYGWFYIIMGLLFMLLYGGEALENIPGAINIGIFALLVGIYEEFLCRGWLLNEFLERYGDTKKGVWVSIITSGIIFGLIHFINVSSNGLAGTITQVLNASASGILFGFIYYRTKNIWSVVLLHAFWDFSLFLGDLSPITEIFPNINVFSVISLIGSVLLVASEFIMLIPFFKDINAKVKNGTIFKYAVIACIAYFFSFFVVAFGSLGSMDESQKIGNISMDEYAITVDNYETYDINEEIEVSDEFGNYITKNYSYSLYKTDSMLVFKNNITGDSVTFDYNYLYDYALYEFDNYYILTYVDEDENANVLLKYYYLYKDELSNEDDYLDIVKNNIKSFMISGGGNLCMIHDKENNHDYVAVETTDYGYFILESEESISILNRD